MRSPRVRFAQPLPSEITPAAVFRAHRRRLLLASLAAGSGLAAGCGESIGQSAPPPAPLAKLAATRSEVAGAMTMEKVTPFEQSSRYNNFYEFGTDKDAPAKLASAMKTRPWSVVVEGECDKPATFDIEQLLKLAPLEERLYRLRCVEGWSMVIPWLGWSLGELLRRVQPRSGAKFVEFQTLADPQSMPMVRTRFLPWPYTEALRIDEAMHPLTMLALGAYGQELANQAGAPVRLVVPWKYGFKSAKSIVRIRLTATQPQTTWHKVAGDEYGWYANVNPTVDHPRWSQAMERRIGEDGLTARRRETAMFNGYAAQVASLYSGLDLERNY